MKPTVFRSVGIVFLAWSALLCSLPEAGFAQEPAASATAVDEDLAGKYSSRIESVEVTESEIIISGQAPTDIAAAAILEVRPFDDFSGDLSKLEMHVPVREGTSVRTRVTRYENGYDRSLSRWAIGSINGPRTLLSTPRYREFPEPEDVAPSTDLAAKKGLGGIHNDPRLYADLLELGVRQITINIALGGLVRFSSEETVAHQYAGRTYHFDTATVANLSRLLKFAGEHDIVSSAIILVPHIRAKNHARAVLTHPGCVDGHYSMANIATREGTLHFAAAIDFLAHRFGNSDNPEEHIANWIVHNEVDAGWVWTNMGEVPVETYLSTYANVLRVTHDCVRRHDPHARVFISLTHHWNEPHQPNPLRFYKSRELLDLLVENTHREGDFAWGVAFHPYPESLFQPRTWADRTATSEFDTPRITFRNIELLDRWMRQPRYLTTSGHVRGILLSEQGFHTRDESPEAQALQAAALAYAWKKIEPLDSIEAFHYHRWIDHEQEGGLNLGLWTVQPGTITWPANKKRSWDVFRTLGTAEQSQAVEFALPVIGIDDWSELWND